MQEGATETRPVKEIECPICHSKIGSYVYCNKKVWLKVGAIRAQHIKGECAVCGSPFYFSSSEKLLNDLIARMTSGR